MQETNPVAATGDILGGASAVAAALSAPGKLTPEVTPNGCIYRTGPGEQLNVTALVEEDEGSSGLSFDSSLNSIMFDKLPGVGDAAFTHSRQIGRRWSQLVEFRKKGKIVTLIVFSYADDLPVTTLTRLGALFASRL